MDKEKKILLFSDLEGTILREDEEVYDQEAMYQFISQVDNLQQVTGAKVNIHLVSPVYKKQMKQIMDKIDRDIARYNILHKKHDRIAEIESGTFTPERGIYEEEYLEDRIIPLKMPKDAREFDTSTYGKANYVKQWCETYRERADLIMTIYCGNGINDLSAMDYIRKQKGGFLVCPQNTIESAKQKAHFVSERADLFGIAEGIGMLNEEIKKRISPFQGEDEEHKR